MPAVCRGDLADLDVVHCEVPKRLECSPDFFVNKKGVSRQGDLNNSHDGPACAKHQAPITSGASKLFINGKGAGRVGDSVSSCTSVATGSPDFFDGSPEG